MPFLAPIAAAAASTFTVAAVSQALVSAGISLALGYAARALGPKPKKAEAQPAQRLFLRLDPNAPREVVFGLAAVAGTLVYQNSYGPNGNDTAVTVIALADHECDGLVRIYSDGRWRSWNETTREVAGFGGKMRVTFRPGTQTQTVPSVLTTQFPEDWDSTDKGRGVCYVVVEVDYDEDVFPRGLPPLMFNIRGAKLYDPRKDSTAGGSGSHRWREEATYEYSANPAVCLYNYRRGIYNGAVQIAGMNTPADALPYDVWRAAMAACAEAMPRRDQTDEVRYTVHGVVSTATPHREVISDMLTAMAAREIDTGGEIKLLPGVSQLPVLAITDDDLMADAPIEITEKRPRSELVNAVFGSFADPAAGYETLALPPRISPSDQTTDGGALLTETYTLDLVTSQTQGQRVMEIQRRRGRHQLQVRVRLRSRFAVLEAGDWITWTSEQYGWINRTFEVGSVTLTDDLQANVVLIETSASIYAWTIADQLDREDPRPVVAGGPSLTQVEGWQLFAMQIDSPSGASRPGLRATWTPITAAACRSIRIEYRRIGDTVALETIAHDPGSGSHSWLNGVQGGTIYEARALPVVVPANRPVEWTSWAQLADPVPDQIVAVAAIALNVDPELIPEAELGAQEAFELSLVTSVRDIQDSVALPAIQGSVNERVREALDLIDRLSEALASQWAFASDSEARLTREEVVRASQGEALAASVLALEASVFDEETGVPAVAAAVSSLETRVATTETGLTSTATAITSLTTTVAGNTTTITEHTTSIDGLSAAWTVAVETNGYVTGLVTLEGGEETTFGVVADKFVVAQPGETGGAPLQVFTIGQLNGVPSIGIAGDVIIDGGIAARHLAVTTLSAVAADLGTVTAGRMLSADGKVDFNLTAGYLRIVA